MGIWNGPNVSTLIERFNETKIVSCTLGLQRIRLLSDISKELAYSSLLLIDTPLENSKERRGYGILIEYGDYSPNMSKEENKLLKNVKVIYRYGTEGGLRYYAINYPDYLKYCDAGYIEMDIKEEDQMTFVDFIERCAPLNDSQWKQKN